MDEVERLKRSVEFYGEMSDSCVWGDTGRRCPYCQCDRVIDDEAALTALADVKLDGE